MGRRVRESQKSILRWAEANLPPRSPDEIMHEFLDAVKELEVAWFTSDSYVEVAEGIGEVAVLLCRIAGEISTEVTTEMDAVMARKRKGS